MIRRGDDVQQGQQQERFERLYDAYAHRVLAYAARRLGRVEAEDVVSETFTVVWRRLADVPDDPLPWILSVARRVVANNDRGSRRRALLQQRVRILSGPDSEHGPRDRTEEQEQVLTALWGLPEKHREVLLLAFWEDLSNQQAATVLGCSAASFAVRLHRARRAIRKELTPSGQFSSKATSGLLPVTKEVKAP
jgi:RNA polymerase sigma-70 factor (ECF subfamily)